MADTFGDVLRSLRTAGRLSQAGLGKRARYSPAAIQHAETGTRPATAELAAACDQALGTTPLLATLHELDNEQGDNMHRRAVVTGLLAAGIGGAATAELLRHGLLEAASADEDWDAAVATYTRRLATDPSPAYGQALLAQLAAARQLTLTAATPDRLRATSQLGQLYGLWLGNGGNVAGARGWYRTASVLADRSGDLSTRIYVRGRAASRGIYEGYTVNETLTEAGEALRLSTRPCAGALEAYSAQVHVHGLTGNLTEGRRAVAGMERVADALPDRDDIAGPAQRVASFRNYLEGRTGPLQAAEAAYAEADRALRSVPVWHADATLYAGMAHVRHGDPTAGVTMALHAVRGLGQDVRVIGLGVRDLVAAVPAGYASTELDELRTYASTSRGPWETLA